MKHSRRCAIGLAIPLLVAANTAQAQSASDIFQFYQLIGSFSINCGKPAAAGNPYSVYRTLDDGNVQFDMMIGPKRRRSSYTIDVAVEVSQNDIEISMTDGNQRFDVVYRVEDGRIRTMESIRESGDQIIAEGRSVANGAPTQWFRKCG
ncbi:MAG: hypothetical protein ACRECO_20625 [Xanthobacteraceae bacterium]